MTLLAFCLGLGLGIAFWLWRQAHLKRQLNQVLRTLEADSEVSLPAISRLRREIAIASQERRQLEADLAIRQDLLQNAPFGYLQVDEENQLIWCNYQAKELLQIQRWIPGQLRLLLELVRSYELDRLIEETRQQQQPCQQEWIFHPPLARSQGFGNRQGIALRGWGLPLPDNRVGIFLENRQALVELSRARDRWVSDLAHELRTPLASISLVAETLETRLQPPLQQWATRLLNEVTRLIGLVQDWLELSQMEAHADSNLVRKPLELRALIRAVWQTLEPIAQQNQLSLTYAGPNALWVKGDKARLFQALLNLLDNSIKYSPPGGSIHVELQLLETETASSWARIDMIDSGTGFPKADLPYIFDRFYRGDPARARHQSPPISPPADLSRSGVQNGENLGGQITPLSNSRGSGLGLAIVQKIIYAHGGSIQAKNHPETGGAWLQVELPDATAVVASEFEAETDDAITFERSSSANP